MRPQTTSTAVTEGIQITVTSRYLPEQSSPLSRRYVWAYTVWIRNQGVRTARLMRRHWIITDGDGGVEEVEGPGVIGKTPRIAPGQAFQYTSGCVLRTPRGTMHGSYQMVRVDSNGEEGAAKDSASTTSSKERERFDVTIAPFALELPVNLN